MVRGFVSVLLMVVITMVVAVMMIITSSSGTLAVGIARLIPLSFCMAPGAGDTFVVAGHAVYPLASLGEDELFDAIRAGATAEAVGMVRFLAGDDGFVRDGQFADGADVGAVFADRRAV
jgi:hypothetical protein